MDVLYITHYKKILLYCVGIVTSYLCNKICCKQVYGRCLVIVLDFMVNRLKCTGFRLGSFRMGLWNHQTIRA